MASLTITRSNDVPNSTYFTTGSAEPTLDGDVLTIYAGDGRRRSGWGAPGVTSTVVLERDDLVAIHVGFHHKHGGGQFWRYYRPVEGAWTQVQWAQLADEDRSHVLAAATHGAPLWAKAPGKLRAEKKAPVIETRIAYKIVRVSDDRMVSAYDGETEYVIGKRVAERAQADHRGGYYSYPSAEGVAERFWSGSLLPERCYEPGAQYALLEVEIGGTTVVYGGDEYWDDVRGMYLESPVKWASTYLRPVRILETFEYLPTTDEKEAC